MSLENRLMRFQRPNKISTEIYAAVVSVVPNFWHWEAYDHSYLFALDVSEFLEEYEFNS
jgi:hypothetical protein